MRVVKSALLSACNRLGLFARGRRKNSNRLLILCYHGFELCDEARFRPGLFISQASFDRRMELLAKHGMEVILFSEALKRMYEKKLPPNAVAITIDDGFASVHQRALPIIQSHGYPATVYITSYYVRKGTPIFRLAVQYIFWKSSCLKADLSSEMWTDEQLIDLHNPAVTDRLIWQCIRYGEALTSEEERQELLDRLASTLQVDLDAIRSTRIVSLLNREEIIGLQQSGMEIGLHTHRHVFPIDDEKVAVREITENREFLRGLIQTDSKHFCYPSGVWDQRQWPWLQSIGIESATTCDVGYNDADTHPYALRRFLDSEDISEIEFVSEICGFSERLRNARRWLKGIPGAASATPHK